MDKYLAIGLGALFFLIGLKIYNQRRLNKEYDDSYNRFLNSKEYKVKDQFD